MFGAVAPTWARWVTASLFLLYGFAKLNGSQFTDESDLFPHKAEMERQGAVHLNDAPGIGVRPDEDALRALAA